jgi:nitrogen fixation/metabolism regulation signal transduction histidine kinase
MNRAAYRSVRVEGQRQAVGEERIGSLEYKSAYAAVLSPQTGQMQAIVSLPYFESASFLERGQALVLSNILKVFVVVFLVFTLIAFLAADSLAAPIRFMAKTLRQTTLSGENLPLSWKAQDEMGMLVQEYNRMVANLAESRRALAQSEKESAWREMAKQVAHEIKNPLTPMKLTLQQLEREGEPGIERVKKAVEVMLRQVEVLDTIASSFSTLARMPALAPQRTDLVELLAQAVALFADTKDGRVQFKRPVTSLWVSVDPIAMTRAVSNVVINALQARVEGQEALVEVEVTTRVGAVWVSIRDNGRGIPEPLQGRIFQPQFTTKESGSGLGLYMARQFVNQSGGRIWFTTSGEGTTFFIELPLAASKET